MVLKVGLGVVLAGLLAIIGMLHGRVGDQEAQIDRLRTRLDGMEAALEEATIAPARPTTQTVARRFQGEPGGAPPPPRALEVDDAMRERVLAAPTRGGEAPNEPAVVVRDALLDVLSTDDPELREGFRNLVREEQAALRDEWQQRRQTRWEERTSERIEGFGREHGLDQGQRDALFGILTAARDRIAETFRAARESEEPPSRETMRATFEATRKQADDEARALLNADQFRAYEAMRDEDGFMGPGPGMGPGRDRGRDGDRSGGSAEGSARER